MIVRLICSIVALLHLVFLAGCSSPDILSDIKADRIDVEIDEKTAISRSKLSSPKLSFRWVETEAGEGLIEATRPSWKEPVFVHPDWIVEGKHIRSALAEENRSHSKVFIDFTKEGAELISKATQNPDGRSVALIVDGVVEMACVVRQPMKDNSVLEGMSDAVALDLAWKINENILNGDLSEANRTWFQRKTIASIIVGVIAVSLVVFVLRKRGNV